MIGQDVRFGVRLLRESPIFAAVSALTIALAVGANTAVFSIVDGVLLKDLPYRDPGKLVRVWGTAKQRGDNRANLSEMDFLDFRSQNGVFEEMAAFTWPGGGVTLAGPGGAERLRLVFVSSGFFRLLGVDPEAGRTFRIEEERPGNDRVAVLSHGLWTRRFGSDPGVVGRTINLNGLPHTVLGVMPLDFRHPEPATGQEPEIWIPLAIDRAIQNRSGRYLRCIGRLRPDVSLERARQDLEALARGLEESYPRTNTGRGVRLEPLHEAVVGDVRRPLWLLFAAVGMVLLIACANVANLLLARSSTRRKEMAIRAAVGASRGRLALQLLTESVLLSFVAAVLGVALAAAAEPLLKSLAAEGVPRLAGLGIDLRAVGFALGLSFVTGMLFGVVPALAVSTSDLHTSLKEGPSAGLGGTGHRFPQYTLVVLETAVAFALVVGAGLLIQSYVRLENVDPGFQYEQVTTTSVSLSPTRYPEPGQQAAFAARLLGRLQTVPGIGPVAVVNYLPLGDGHSCDAFTLDAEPPPAPGAAPCAEYRRISSEYFRAMGIPLLKGRAFRAEDDDNAPPVAIVDETLARRFWEENDDPIGERVTSHGVSREIVGIVGAVKHFGLDREAPLGLYVPQLQDPVGELTLVVRTPMEISRLQRDIQTEVSALDPDLPLYNTSTLEELVSRSVAQPRFRSSLLGLFAAAALLLATVGVYGVVYQSTTGRNHEMGVRMALGAESIDILKMILAEGLRLGAFGILFGAALALVLTRFLSSVLFQMSAFDAVTYSLVGAILIAAILSACYVPARRASRVEPTRAIRYE